MPVARKLRTDRSGSGDQVLLPLPKIERQALCLPLYFSLARIRTRQRGTAAPRAVRVVGRVRASGTQTTSRPRRQARQVRPSIFTKLRRNRPPFPCSKRPFPSALIRLQPPPSPPAPRTHPVSPFSGFSGCVFFFSLFFGRKIFGLVFVHPAVQRSQVEAIGDTM